MTVKEIREELAGCPEDVEMVLCAIDSDEGRIYGTRKAYIVKKEDEKPVLALNIFFAEKLADVLEKAAVGHSRMSKGRAVTIAKNIQGDYSVTDKAEAVKKVMDEKAPVSKEDFKNICLWLWNQAFKEVEEGEADG